MHFMHHIKISNITVFDIELLKSLEHILPKGNICLDKRKAFIFYLHILLYFIMWVKILFFLRLCRSRTSGERNGALHYYFENTKGTYINDVRRFSAIFDPPPPLIRFCPISAHAPIIWRPILTLRPPPLLIYILIFLFI